MRSVSALDVRRRFGQLLDEAAAGERLIIQRAGQPIAALVPLSDVPELDRHARIERRREAVADLVRFARRNLVDSPVDSATLVREQRRQRTEQIVRAAEAAKKRVG